MHIYNIYNSTTIVEVAIENRVKRVNISQVFILSFKYASQGYKEVEKKISEMTDDLNCPTKITILRPTMIYGDL